MSERASFADYRERLAALGFHPSRRLGQNFLLEPDLHRVIADAAAVCADDVVLEIGAGLGFLTRELVPRARRVVAVEIDARLCSVLREDLAALPGGERVEVLHMDVLAGAGELAPAVVDAMREARGPVKVVANLPYAVTGPVLAALCRAPTLPARAAVLVQLEVAERLCARPKTAEYGSLTALVQACFAVRLVRRVGREVFRPRPNVDSAIVEFAADAARPAASWGIAERRSFAVFVRALFAARRKKLRHGLRLAAAAVGAADLTLAPPVPGPGDLMDCRPGDLDLPTLTALWRAVRPQP
ncbi:MAG: 16S rRNA (adenine(1518)-N(6)/adenine(1519)-N(6))-dimethyltransferase RsmA [Planctomycetota bacterium]